MYVYILHSDVYTYIIQSVCTLHIVLYFFYCVDITWLLLESMKMFLIAYTSVAWLEFLPPGADLTLAPTQEKNVANRLQPPQSQDFKAHQLIIYFPQNFFDDLFFL